MAKSAFIVSLFYLIIPLAALPQKVSWSSPLSDWGKTDYIRIIGQNNDGFQVLRSNHPISTGQRVYSYRNTRLIVSLYSYDMRLLWEKTPEPLKKEARILTFVPVADKLAEISLEWDKQDNKFRMLSRFYNSSGVADTSYNVMAEDDIASVDDDSPVYITTSKDRKSFLISYKNKYESSSQNFTSLVCDSGFKVVKKSIFMIPLSAKYFNVSEFLLTNDRQVFLFGIKTDEEKRSRDPDRNYYTLYKDNGTDHWKEYVIRAPEKYLTDAGTAVDEMNKTIVVAGFYSDRTSFSSNGVFYYNVSLSQGNKETIGYSAFSGPILNKLIGERREFYNRDRSSYSIDKIILRNDGGAVIIAETVYTTEYSYYDYYMRHYVNRVYYHFDNIIEVSVSKDGNMPWLNVIRKEQTSENIDNEYVSYAFGTGRGKLRCVYNRYLKRNTQVMLSSTDVLGNEKEIDLFSEGEDVYILPGASKQVDENLLIIPAYKGKEFRLAGVSF